MTRSARLGVALGLNAALVVGQVVAGILSHSTGLLADGGHNLADAAAVATSLFAVRWAAHPRSDTRSFGMHRTTILAALWNAGLLLVVTIAVTAFGIIRLAHPVHVGGTTVAVTAAIAVALNGAAALVLAERGRDLNMRSALLHMTSDALAAFFVLVAGVVIAVSGHFDRLDPAASLLVSVLIAIQAYRLLRASIDVLLESTPDDIDPVALRRTITVVEGVEEVHDLHVWSLSSDVRALSAHLVLAGHPTLEEAQAVGEQVRIDVEVPYRITHTTFEMECERCEGEPCGFDVQTRADPE